MRGREMYTYERLSPDELDALLRKRSSDPRARTEIVRAMTRLVVHWASAYVKLNVLPIEDLVQEGMMGLLEAINRYNPDYPSENFHTLVWFWVRRNCSRAISASRRAVIVKPGRVTLTAKQLAAAEQETLRVLGTATIDDIVAVTGLPRDRVELAMFARRSDRSFDAPMRAVLGEPSEMTLHGILPAGDPTPEQMLEEVELRDRFDRAKQEFMATLDAREKHIFETRILPEGGAPVAGTIVGQQLGCSRQNVSLIEGPLRDAFAAHLRRAIT